MKRILLIVIWILLWCGFYTLLGLIVGGSLYDGGYFIGLGFIFLISSILGYGLMEAIDF